MPRRKGGLWLPVDVNFMDDPRIIRAGRDAAWLYLAMCLASKRVGSDGRLEPIEVNRLHINGWMKLMPRLLREELVLDLGDDVYTIAAWFRHNDPQVKVERKRAVDREYHASKRRDRVGTDSGQSRGAEKRREEKREVANTINLTDCEHGVDRGSSCRRCPPPATSLRSVSA